MKTKDEAHRAYLTNDGQTAIIDGLLFTCAHKVATITAPKAGPKKGGRLNWKTKAKLKKLKDAGYTSGQAAEELKKPLEKINEFWGDL